METPKSLLSADKDGSVTQKLDTLVNRARSDRAWFEQTWKESLLFLDGFHWTRIDPLLKHIDPSINSQVRMPHRQRLVSDHIFAAVQRRLAKLTHNRPVFEAMPATSDAADRKSARLAAALLDYLWEECDCRDKLFEVLLYSFCGQGYWEVFWDDTVGKKVSYVRDPMTGKPIPSGSDEAQELRRQMSEIEEVVTMEGEVGLEVLSPFEIIPFGDSDPQRAHTVIKIKGYDPDYVEERWGVRLKPDTAAIADFASAARQTTQETNHLVEVKQLYIKPCRNYPEGKYIVWAKGKTLHEGKFPYAHGRMPFVKFRGIILPGAKYDDSWVRRLIPLQKEINSRVSQIGELMDRVLYPPITAPVGSLDPDNLPEGKPNEIIWYRPIPGMPQARPDHALSVKVDRSVYEYIDHIKERLDDVSGQHEVSRGQAPPNVEAFAALQALQEADDTALAPVIQSLERSLSQAGRLMLELAKERYTLQRVIDISGSSGAPYLESFTKADLSGAKDVRVPEGSMIPRSRAAEQDLLWQLMQAGAITPERFIASSDIGSAELKAIWTNNRNKQVREIELAKAGNPVPEPGLLDDDAAHLDVLAEFMSSPEFEDLDPMAKAEIEQHAELHQQRQAEAERAELMKQVRLSLAAQLRGDVSPSTVSEMLNAGAGIQLDPGQIEGEVEGSKDAEMDRRQELEAVKSTLRQQDATAKDLRQTAIEELRSQLRIDELQAQAELEQEKEAVSSELRDQEEERRQLREMIARGAVDEQL